MILSSIKKMKQGEREIAEELMNIGLAHAADAFSGTIGEQVLIEALKFNFRRNPRHFRLPKLEGKQSLVLTTDIKGDIPGACFLILDSDAVKDLGNKAMPPSLRDLPESELAGMRQEMLLELDNIVTAAVVTQLANLLGVGIHGSVPRGQVMEGEELENFLRKMSVKYRPNVIVSTQFNTEALAVGPKFLWYFGEEMVNSVRQLKQTKGVKSLIREAV